MTEPTRVVPLGERKGKDGKAKAARVGVKRFFVFNVAQCDPISVDATMVASTCIGRGVGPAYPGAEASP